VRCVIGFLEKSGYATGSGANVDGSGSAMAKIIEFYIPNSFRKKRPWIPAEERGKLIEFPAAEKKSA
jgi:hypothetical protein